MSEFKRYLIETASQIDDLFSSEFEPVCFSLIVQGPCVGMGGMDYYESCVTSALERKDAVALRLYISALEEAKHEALQALQAL